MIFVLHPYSATACFHFFYAYKPLQNWDNFRILLTLTYIILANNSQKISKLRGFELKQRSARFFARIYCRSNHITVQKNALFTHQKIILSPRPRESLRCPMRHFGKVPINATNLHHLPIEPSISELWSTSAKSGIFSSMLRKSVQPQNAEPRSFVFSYNSFQH